MYSFIYAIFFVLKRKERRLYDKPGIRLKMIHWILGYIEAYYNLFVAKSYVKHPSRKKGITERKRDQKIIVSLTSYPKRIHTVWITIETLLRQNMKPDEIILWLAKDQFDGMESLPSELLAQRDRGLTIRFCDDLRSHKKYFYAMQEYPEDLIVLADDDIFYPKDMIRQLYRMHQKNPKEIVCMTAAVISPDLTSPPSMWRKVGANEKIEHSYVAQPYTGAGTLYPPQTVSKKAFQKEVIMSICPYADDLWLKFMSLANGVKVTSMYKFRSIPITIYETGQNGLWYINAQGGKNDEQWQKILEYFRDDVLWIEEQGLLNCHNENSRNCIWEN